MNCEFATVSIFSHAAIASLNNLEMMVYHYVIKNRDKVMSITSHEHSRLAKLADFNLSWHVPQTRIGGVYDITTQIPVIYILETLGRKLARKLV
ncbi:TPA: hypothetical protein LVM01_002362 [Klebsiella oxytoca]|nr:hypothetical protein [Klebsiella oxytoca]